MVELNSEEQNKVKRMKRRKNSTLKAGKRRPNYFKIKKKNNEKAEKYHTNEGTN